uniref:Uncharacterized protein n=1 Tax=Podoviridae sp. ct8Lf7 TaxID=2827723 RepID=A0A8S5S170_9CAUD|nr:MAG TPA: hypothetical protein [Podoviridae sp. ct8Lf7]
MLKSNYTSVVVTFTDKLLIAGIPPLLTLI